MFALFGRTFVFQIAINSKQNSLIMKNLRIFPFFFVNIDWLHRLNGNPFENLLNL